MKRLVRAAWLVLLGCGGAAEEATPVPSTDEITSALRIPGHGGDEACGAELDEFADGSIDGVASYGPTSARTVYTDDSRPDSYEQWALDNAGRLVSITMGEEGSPPSHYQIFYDAVGRLIERRMEFPDDGTAKVTRSLYSMHDPSGRPQRAEVLVDDVLVSRRAYHRDSLGRVVLVENDQGVDGTVDSTTATTYDDAAHRSVSRHTSAGVPVSELVRTFDPQGRYLSEEYRYLGDDDDGIPDTTTTWSYDDGRLVSYRYEEADGYALTETYLYDCD